MKRGWISLTVLVVVCACAQPRDSEDEAEMSLSALAHENQTNLVNLNIGMKKAEVLKIMGRKSAQTRDGLIANPFKVETFRDRSGTQYEILYYVTERNRRFQPLRTGNATPLVFKDGELVGWGGHRHCALSQDESCLQPAPLSTMIRRNFRT